MSLYTIAGTVKLAPVTLPEGLTMEESTDISLLSALGTVSAEEVQRRLANENNAYVAFMNNIPAAFGWVARGKARIGELGHEMILPTGNRYLWNFRTLETFRGLGIYPALLQYILQTESKKANRFWIIHAPENKASLKGIRKAGFRYTGKLYSRNGITLLQESSIARNYRRLLAEMGILLSTEEPFDCWNCSSPYLKKRTPTCCCTGTEEKCTGNLITTPVH
ncbi:MAG TPA: N-acetyltransferase [Ferruginibacter sp.]|nr:N-acetyltransferase [Chitinophagaceae bacterium]HRI25181.1 N-acetyltransferase [Ferruginibacter sp.]